MSAILVTGATGKQGGSLIKSLLKKDAPFQILAVTRDTQSASSQKLSKESSKITLVQGDLDHPAELFKKAQELTSVPIWGVFSVQVAIGNSASEEGQGKSLVDAALKNGVKQFVYSSVDRGGAKSINTPTQIPHFVHKHNIEKHLMSSAKDTSMQWTILRPTAFYENLTPDFFGKVFATSFKTSLKGKPLQMVGVSDIGAVAAEGFLHAESYQGHAISLAGDELTYDQFGSIFEKKTGQALPTTFRLFSAGIMAMIKDMGYMFKWFHDEGYGADVEEVRRIHPDVKDFGTWLDTESQFVKR
ncbi:nucleoside-diphosphate-sugar epimerase family protein [Aspergillus steynii IBT 23096]|uniref:Nucleoside-diphosphate-sugar epimerase family protein n=1 Tax=Aspergillus steynii IBT 23096 TaxID=1392250 RepID=A0A2I2GF97_9EURO|nr:nucleoside-diphosphate-sugar epimerase family protein [Aspergillus steynii IBT 23096]PLB51507.1 nucleoside-diphosphate-sugar epimerase family protein [Aspergillus steynii IBT 23096]